METTHGSVLASTAERLRNSLPSDPDEALNEVEDVGALVVAVLDRSDLSQKEAALTMGISETRFTKQLKGEEHLSLRRLWSLPDRFWRELLIEVARRKRVARVRRQVVMEMR